MDNNIQVFSTRLYSNDINEFRDFAVQQKMKQKEAFHELVEIAKQINSTENKLLDQVMVFTMGIEGELYQKGFGAKRPLKRFSIIGHPVLILNPFRTKARQYQEALRKEFLFLEELNDTYELYAFVNVFYDVMRKKYLLYQYVVIGDSMKAVLTAHRFFYVEKYDDLEGKIPKYISDYNRSMIENIFKHIEDVKISETEEMIEEYYKLNKEE